jgi:hypothetical protein
VGFSRNSTPLQPFLVIHKKAHNFIDDLPWVMRDGAEINKKVMKKPKLIAFAAGGSLIAFSIEVLAVSSAVSARPPEISPRVGKSESARTFQSATCTPTPTPTPGGKPKKLH